MIFNMDMQIGVYYSPNYISNTLMPFLCSLSMIKMMIIQTL